MKRTLHLIYTVPRGTLVERVQDRLSGLGLLPYRYRDAGKGITWTHPIRSPHVFTYHLLQALTPHFNVKLYSMYEHGVCNTQPGDIVLAQPAPVLPHIPPQDIDTRAITYRTFTEREGITKIIIMPYSHDETYTKWWSDLVRDHGKNCIFISGEPWFATWETNSPFKDFAIQNKLRIDVGVDTDEYPLVKTSFNPPGKRGILYIGHTGWYKNTGMLEAIQKQMPGVRFGHVGGGTIEGFEKLDDFALLTPDYLSRVAQDFDIFVNVSTGDPNATTILEMASAGFVVACTPESGYEMEHFMKLSAADIDASVNALQKLIDMPTEELVEKTRRARSYVEEKYRWDRIMEDVLGFIQYCS